MSDYTPDTTSVRDMWSWMREDTADLPMSEGVAEFDRWLAAHDAEVRADEREKAAQRVENMQNASRYISIGTSSSMQRACFIADAAAAARGDGEQK